MSALLAALYSLCILALTGFALFVLARDPRASLNRCFALLSLALLGWVASLFAFDLRTEGTALLWLGRLNFASVVFATTLAFLFVRQVAGRPARPAVPWLWAETGLLAALTLLTPFVDRQELVQTGQHVTVYGPLFIPYVLHVLVLLGAALRTAFRSGKLSERDGREPHRIEMRNQLRVVGFGVVAVAAIGLVTNVYLPYALGDFRLIHVGTLSTVLFLLAVGYAVFAYHLFSIRVIVRATFVVAGLIALALELYSLALSFLAHLLPFGDPREREFAATALVLVVNAFTQEPVRRCLERLIDSCAIRNRDTLDAKNSIG